MNNWSYNSISLGFNQIIADLSHTKWDFADSQVQFWCKLTQCLLSEIIMSEQKGPWFVTGIEAVRRNAFQFCHNFHNKWAKLYLSEHKMSPIMNIKIFKKTTLKRLALIRENSMNIRGWAEEEGAGGGWVAEEPGAEADGKLRAATGRWNLFASAEDEVEDEEGWIGC